MESTKTRKNRASTSIDLALYSATFALGLGYEQIALV